MAGVESSIQIEPHKLYESPLEIHRMNSSSSVEYPPRMKIFNFMTKELQQTLEKLVMKAETLTRAGQSEWQKCFGSAVSCRHGWINFMDNVIEGNLISLINGWTDFLDNVLEDNLISLINGWIPNRLLLDLVPYSVEVITIYPTTQRVVNGINVISLPPFLAKSFNKRNPFVGKSLVVTCFHRDYVYAGLSLVVNVLIVRFAHQLSVLCLTSMSLDLENFRNILKASENLKVLILDNFKVGVKDGIELRSPRFPTLPKLKTLILLNFFCVYGYCICNNAQQQHFTLTPLQDYNVWLFNEYATQLEKLDFRYYKSVQVGPLASLKQLSIIATSLSFFDKICVSNVLERLSISSLGESGINKVRLNVNDLFVFMERSASTLIELYLDIECIDGLQSVECDKKDLESQVQQQGNQSFTSVKKLTLPYPKNEEIMQMYAESFLKRLTMLDHLALLDYFKGWYPLPFYYSPVDNTLPAPPFFDCMWRACANLKTISILKRDNMQQFYTYSQSTFVRPEGL